VVDIEVVSQLVIQLHKNTCAFRWRNIGDGHMAGEGVALRTQTPDVEVVDVHDAFHRFHAGPDVIELDTAWRSFEENVEGFADDIEAGPEDEGSDDKRKHGVNPAMAGVEDGCATSDDGGGGEGVSCHVQEGAAQVNVAGHAPEECGDDAIHEDAGGGHPHHQPRLNGYGGAEAMDGLDHYPDGNEDQGRGVDECGEDAGALISERFGTVSWAGLKVDGYEAEKEGEEVGGVVTGFG